jgi:hypothetical protein
LSDISQYQQRFENLRKLNIPKFIILSIRLDNASLQLNAANLQHMYGGIIRAFILAISAAIDRDQNSTPPSL